MTNMRNPPGPVQESQHDRAEYERYVRPSPAPPARFSSMIQFGEFRDSEQGADRWHPLALLGRLSFAMFAIHLIFRLRTLSLFVARNSHPGVPSARLCRSPLAELLDQRLASLGRWIQRGPVCNDGPVKSRVHRLHISSALGELFLRDVRAGRQVKQHHMNLSIAAESSTTRKECAPCWRVTVGQPGAAGAGNS